MQIQTIQVLASCFFLIADGDYEKFQVLSLWLFKILEKTTIINLEKVIGHFKKKMQFIIYDAVLNNFFSNKKKKKQILKALNNFFFYLDIEWVTVRF